MYLLIHSSFLIQNAFGFNSKAVPQTGQPGFEYNYQVMQWYSRHWNDRVSGTATVQNVKVPYTDEPIKNPLAVQITFSIYFPLMIIKLTQKRIGQKLSKATKATWWWKLIEFVINIMPFIAIIIAASVVYLYKTGSESNMYSSATLSVVGNVIPGLNFVAAPKLPYPFGQFLISCLPVTFIAFMESYAVANRIATQRNELHILNASQELFAVGVANLMASVSQAYPVCGSFSRSALNAASGARTPLSKVTCLIVVIVALNNLTSTFYYIPQSALAAVIWVS